MNRRQRKKAEKMRRAKLHEAFDLVLDINGLGVRRKDVSGDLPTVFIWYSGHIAKIDIEVYRAGWGEEDCNSADNYNRFSIYTNGDFRKTSEEIDALRREKTYLSRK